jgi:hypothetical protein
MMREEAVAEAARMQRDRPGATYVALARGGAWVVVRVGVPARAGERRGTALKPPPPPHGPVQSELQRVATQYGAAG